MNDRARHTRISLAWLLAPHVEAVLRNAALGTELADRLTGRFVVYERALPLRAHISVTRRTLIGRWYGRTAMKSPHVSRWFRRR